MSAFTADRLFEVAVRNTASTLKIVDQVTGIERALTETEIAELIQHFEATGLKHFSELTFTDPNTRADLSHFSAPEFRQFRGHNTEFRRHNTKLAESLLLELATPRADSQHSPTFQPFKLRLQPPQQPSHSPPPHQSHRATASA